MPRTKTSELPAHVDVLIVGAGVSGIAAAYYLGARCPSKSYAVIEARDDIGGTWDLFRYPGIRSDSDLYTFGFSFRPWTADTAFASGPQIKTYIKDTAREFGIDKHIRFGRKAVKAAWDSQAALWTVTVERGGKTEAVTCHMLYMCPGYYDYAAGYRPEWDNEDEFKGQIIHPQDWPEDLDYSGKKIVVIGSGATAVTLLPSLAETAEHVTMLQRSPSYITEMPARDGLAIGTRKVLGAKAAHGIIRWKNILRTIFYYNLARKFPDFVKKGLKKAATEAIGVDFDVETHLSPTYAPWDQRVCIDKDGEMFAAIKSGKASIATDTIARFTKDGLTLGSGADLPADIIVTATGLNMRLMGGMDISLDGEKANISQTYMYKGMMFSGLPNLFYSIGYTNASWTLKCELIARYACRLINTMDQHGSDVIVPEVKGDIIPQPALDLQSGYIFRSEKILPKQGTKAPWRVHQNYIFDKLALGMGSVEDGVMRFSKRG